MAELRHEHPGKAVELRAEDEARLGLKPVARRVWAVKGRRPTASGRTKYQWLYVYGFLHPASGRNLELNLPAANTDWVAEPLAEFAPWADPAGEKLLVVLVDNDGRHVARRLGVPPNVVLHQLPPCTPELQPAEPLWPLVCEAMANRGFDDLDVIQGPLVERCRWVIDHPEVVRGPVGFEWAVALYGYASRRFGISRGAASVPRADGGDRAASRGGRGYERCDRPLSGGGAELLNGGVFSCYDTAGLPRTNNALEQLFGSYRHYERRASGRKVASPGMVVRGSVRLASATATLLRPIEGADLVPTALAVWRVLRGGLERRQEVRRITHRFRRDPVAYLQSLRDILIKPVAAQ